jgi:hypothetical protein
MSWSVNYIGSPASVATALTAHAGNLDGQSRVEYDSALPHMVALVSENFAEITPVIKLAAAGHSYANNGEQKQRQFVISIERLYATVV